MDQLLLLVLLIGALVLFASERGRADLVSLGLLLCLMLTGIVNVQEGFSGFASPAVITVVCMFILSGGLVRTGVADELAGWVVARGLRGTLSLTVVLMLMVGVMSSFMNNIAAVTILMPSVFAIAQRTGVPVTKLLMPLAFGSLMGGLSTLVGTPPNLLASEALSNAGYAPFKMFDYLPTGISVFLIGLTYFIAIGSRLVPVRTPAAAPDEGVSLRHYVTEAVVPKGSTLIGRSVEQARLRDMAGVTVLRIHRAYNSDRGETVEDRPWLRFGRYGRDEEDGTYSFLPWPEATFEAEDHVQLEGDPSQLLQKQGRGWLEIPEANRGAADALLIGEVALAVRSTFGDEPTLNRIYFERAAGLEGQAAIDCWRLCLQCGDSMAHFGLGTTLLEAGQAREAYQHLRHYVRIAPLVAWNWRWYGKAAEEIGETGEARRAYGRAIEIESKYCQEETDAANLLAALEGSRRQKDGQTDDPGEESNRKDNP